MKTISMHQITLEIVSFVKINVQKCPIFCSLPNSWLSTINKPSEEQKIFKNSKVIKNSFDKCENHYCIFSELQNFLCHFCKTKAIYQIWSIFRLKVLTHLWCSNDDKPLLKCCLMNGCRFFVPRLLSLRARHNGESSTFC